MDHAKFWKNEKKNECTLTFVKLEQSLYFIHYVATLFWKVDRAIFLDKSVSNQDVFDSLFVYLLLWGGKSVDYLIHINNGIGAWNFRKRW